jgi:hypothetical protein
MGQSRYPEVATRALAALALALAACQPASSQPVLGFDGCTPVLFRRLPSSEIRVAITKISYDSVGRVSSFQEDVVRDRASASSRSEVSVMHDRQRGSCANAKYTVTQGRRQFTSGIQRDFKTGDLAGHFAFKVTDLGGIIGIGRPEGDFVTKFAYDSLGRRQLASQAFSLGGVRYEVTYPKMTFDRGRLTDYEAVLKPTPPQ